MDIITLSADEDGLWLRCYCVLANSDRQYDKNSELAQVPLLVVLLILQFCIIKENRTSSFVMKVLSAYEQKNMKVKLSLVHIDTAQSLSTTPLWPGCVTQP